MKASDLPALPPKLAPVSQKEIDHINELYANLRRSAKQALKDAMEMGDWFSEVRTNRLPSSKPWGEWLKANFPKIAMTTIHGFRQLAANREFVLTTMKGDDDLHGVKRTLDLIAQRKRTAKPRVRAIVVASDAEPHVLLEAKLKNYVINLYLLRYLEVEIHGMLEGMNLSPDQILRILRFVCKDHPEVEEEVLGVFYPKLKVLPKGA